MLGISSGLIYPSYLREDTTYSLLLDGTGDYLDTGASFQSTFRGSFSVACWVKPDEGRPSPHDHVWGFQHVPVSSTTNQCSLSLHNGYFQFHFAANADLVGTVTQNDSIVPIFSAGPAPWTHVVCVMEMDTGSDNSAGRIYINGVKADSTDGVDMTKSNHQAYVGNDIYIGAEHLILASAFDGPSTEFLGKIDEFAIWGEALDDDAIAEIYNQRYNSSHDLTQDIGDYDNSSDLVSYYRMNEGTGSTVADSEGSNNGTLVGDATFDLNSSDD